MWQLRVALMWPITAASVVDLPDPVAPVQRTRPRGCSASSWIPSGRARSAKGARGGERVDAQARQPGSGMGNVELAGLLEEREPRGVPAADDRQELLEVR